MREFLFIFCEQKKYKQEKKHLWLSLLSPATGLFFFFFVRGDLKSQAVFQYAKKNNVFFNH